MAQRNILHNRYIIVKEIASGGFATVFKSWDLNLERIIAIKRIHKHLVTNVFIQDLFRKEALNAANLQHENILQVHDFFRATDNICYIIMEYADGKDLATIIKTANDTKTKIPEQIAVKIIYDTLKGLSYAHEKKDPVSGTLAGIVHMDISPGNILVYYDGKVKLADFGIAKAISVLKDKSQKTVFAGKFSYMSPEQIEGGIIDQKTDFYSLGVVFYELLAGEKLFQGKNEEEISKKVIKNEIDYSKISREINPILEKMLNKKAITRAKNCRELISDIGDYAAKKGYKLAQNEITEYINKLIPRIDNPAEKELIEQVKKEKFTAKEISESFESEKTPVPITDLHEIDEKTVIEQIYAGMKKNIGFIATIAIVAVFGFILFEMFVDIPRRITPVGKSINRSFLPFKVTIDSVPSNAKIQIFDKHKKDILAKKSLSDTTPIIIPKLAPGYYTVVLQKQNYDNVIKDIKLLDIDNIQSKTKEINLIIPFEIKLHLASFPDNAEVFIDGKKTGLTTPATISLEIGQHAIRYYKQGYIPAGSMNIDRAAELWKCNLDFVTQIYDLDENLWQLKETANEMGILTYVLKATLRREISIHTIPKEAQVYLLDSKQPKQLLGISPVYPALKEGKNQLRIVKPGYKVINPVVEINDSSLTKFTFKLPQ